MKQNYQVGILKGAAAFLLAAVLTLAMLPLTAAASAGQFSVRAIIPENQVDKRQTYFDLRLEPGQTQTVQVEVSNFGSSPLEVEVGLNPATTSRDGLIVYNQAGLRDESMAVSITDIAKTKQSRITVPAGGVSRVEVALEMPQEKIEGVVLGGLVFSTVGQETQSSQSGQGIQLTNEYVYVIGMKLTESDHVPAPDFQLKTITPGLVNYRTSVVVNLQNTQPRIVKNMEITGEIYSKQGQLLHDLYLDNAEMAPNSSGDFVIDWENQELMPGDYRLYMRAVYEGDIWEWDQTFNIPSNVAQAANSGAVGVNTRGSSRTMWISLLAVLLLIVIILLLYYRRRHRRESGELQ